MQNSLRAAVKIVITMAFATTWMTVLGTTTIAAFVMVMVLLMERVTVMETFWTALVNVAALLLRIYVVSVAVMGHLVQK
jgi:hypothetical protein